MGSMAFAVPQQEQGRTRCAPEVNTMYVCLRRRRYRYAALPVRTFEGYVLHVAVTDQYRPGVWVTLVTYARDHLFSFHS
jgi:hypothetical protein